MIRIDLVTSTTPIEHAPTIEPANRLWLPRLASFPYRVYPVAAQVADKVAATLELHDGRPSSREKDLVDLVTIAKTQAVDGVGLRRALTDELARRGIEIPNTFRVPSNWGIRYRKLANSVPYCADHQTVKQGEALVRALIRHDPAVSAGRSPPLATKSTATP